MELEAVQTMLEPNGGKIDVLDSAGDLKAFLMALPLGGVVSILSDNSPQVLMRSDWDGGQVIVFGQNELPGAVMAFGDSGGILQLFDPQGHRRATLPEAIDEDEDDSE